MLVFALSGLPITVPVMKGRPAKNILEKLQLVGCWLVIMNK